MPSELSELTDITPLSAAEDTPAAFNDPEDPVEDGTEEIANAEDIANFDSHDFSSNEAEDNGIEGDDDIGEDIDHPSADAPLLSDDYLDGGEQALAPHLENRSGNSLATRLEAILYLKAQPLALNVLSELTGADRAAVKEGLMDLIGDYAHRQTALEIAETPKGYSLQLKESFNDLVHFLVPVDLGVAALRTLATIALRGPISQTELVDFRGSGAYDHVKELVEQGFVAKRRQSNGRSYWLQVTDQFYQYFQMQGIPELKLTAKAAKRKAEAEAKVKAEEEAESAQAELFSAAEATQTEEVSVSPTAEINLQEAAAQEPAGEIDAINATNLEATNLGELSNSVAEATVTDNVTSSAPFEHPIDAEDNEGVEELKEIVEVPLENAPVV